MIATFQQHERDFYLRNLRNLWIGLLMISFLSAVRVLRRFTAEDSENAENKVASRSYMKFAFPEPATDHDPGISAKSHLA